MNVETAAQTQRYIGCAVAHRHHGHTVQMDVPIAPLYASAILAYSLSFNIGAPLERPVLITLRSVCGARVDDRVAHHLCLGCRALYRLMSEDRL
jgi:hypothetical protein